MIKRLLAFALALVVFACTEPDYIPPQGGDEPDGTEIPKLPSEVDDIYQPNDYAKARAEVLKRGRGYYKDVFMDGGINLTSRRTLPATDFLGVSLELFMVYLNEKHQKELIRIAQEIDEVEKIGIRRAEEALERAELVLAVFDSSEDLTQEDFYP